MPRALPLALRQQVASLGQVGLPPGQIASLLHLAPRTVRRWCQRFTPSTAERSLAPAYDRCGRTLSPTHHPLRAQCFTLRQEHPAWGAGRLRIALQHLHPGATLPSIRTVQLWLKAAGWATPRTIRPRCPHANRRATEAHQVWQMDAAEHLRLRSGTEASWLRLVDEASGAVLATVVFPPRRLASGFCNGGASGLTHRL